MSNNKNSHDNAQDKQHLVRPSLEKEQCTGSVIPALNLASMTCSLFHLARIEDALWFCLKTQPKHEHLAATALRRQLKLMCFSPRVRFRKATRRGAVWFVEAMFPGYLFAEFIYPLLHRRVEHSSGICGVVHFGDQIATVGPDTIEALQE